MDYLFDSFDVAIAGLLDVDIQEYCGVMDNLYKEDFKKWRRIIDRAKGGSVEELKDSKIEFSLCLKQLKS